MGDGPLNGGWSDLWVPGDLDLGDFMSFYVKYWVTRHGHKFNCERGLGVSMLSAKVDQSLLELIVFLLFLLPLFVFAGVNVQ